MLSGLFLTGGFMGPLMIPNMAEMMYSTKQAFPDCDMDHANSLLSGMLNASFGLGQSLGPILGSTLYQMTDYRLMNDIIGSIVLF